jgi:hypothetical protein
LLASSHVHAAAASARNGFEDARTVSEILQFWQGKQNAVQPEPWIAEPDSNQAIGFGKGQRPQQHRIHDAENRRIRPDPKRERQNGERGEHGLLTQHTQGVANVLCQRIYRPHPTHVAALFFHLIDAADQDARLPLSIVAAQAVSGALCNVLFEVKSKLVSELVFDALAAE